MRRKIIACALLSAALFGASTPAAKLLLGEVSPLFLAGLLYLGSGIGLLGWLAVRHAFGRSPVSPLPSPADYPWLIAAVATGGVLAPVFFVFGLSLTGGASASLLLNLEAVLTAAIAWVIFRENVDRRVFAGMTSIVAGGVLLSWQEMPEGFTFPTGPLLIGAACLAWAIDNNLTRRVSGGDAVSIACVKGLVAGSVNLAMALELGGSLPPANLALVAGLIGFAGYGVSLVLFIIALRGLGTARTGAYFSVAPFFGAATALVVLDEQLGGLFWVAAALMAVGVWLHLSEHHEHLHVHAEADHTHDHEHDVHHQHPHPSGIPSEQTHSHAHQHRRLRHAHPHYPDTHHRHGH